MVKVQTVMTIALMVATGISVASAETIQVGPGRAYTKIRDAVNVAHDGDTIEVDSGIYLGSAGWTPIPQNNLTIRGVGPTRPVLDAGDWNLLGKAIFIISGTNVTVENFEFINCKCDDRNGAGIRHEGTDLTVRNCCFRDNEDGILTGANSSSDILVEYSEFDHNGYGDGYSHNMYIGACGSFTLRYCYSHDTREGHEVKSRALKNYILYNLLSSENGTGSRELQLAQGGTCYVIGNVIQQGPNSHNSGIVVYGGEGSNPNPYLYVVNNTLINLRQNGATFLEVNNSPTEAVLRNNIIQRLGNETIVGGAYAGRVTQTSNWLTTDAHVASIVNHDYHLTSASTGAIDLGTAPGTGYNSYALTPTLQYRIPCDFDGRPVAATLDIGAYEYGTANQHPTVDAGLSQAIMVPSVANLSGTASDDGLPTPPGAMTYTWSKASGPGTVTFGNANALSTTASFSGPGTYMLQLLASDSQLNSTDTVTITVNRAPTVDAGMDQSVYEGQTVHLHATASDPDSDPLTYEWMQTAGLTVVLSKANTADASFTAPAVSTVAQAGMTFGVTVNDGQGGTADDSVNVRVYLAGDANRSDVVDISDLLALGAAWASTVGDPRYNPSCDFNNDGAVDASDMLMLEENWSEQLK